MVPLIFIIYEQFYLFLMICLHPVKYFQVLLSNINNSFKPQLFVYTQLNIFKYYYLTLTVHLNLSYLFTHN